MSTQFKTHPDSIARRIEAQQLEDAKRRLDEPADDSGDDVELKWFDLTPDSSPEEVDAALKQLDAINAPVEDPLAAPLRPPGAITSCPLDSSWRLWDMFNTPTYWEVPEDAQRIVEAALAATPSSHLGLVALDWEMARDDAASVLMTEAESGQPDGKYSEGSPRHLHAESVIDGARVHVDWVYARKHGPGRSITEIRIFVDDRLAGRGGRCGCALGIGKNDLPAVALLGGGKALTVDDVTSGALHARTMPELVAELWLVEERGIGCG